MVYATIFNSHLQLARMLWSAITIQLESNNTLSCDKLIAWKLVNIS